MSPMRVRLVRHMQDRSTEWLSSIVMLGWGIILAQPGDAMAGPQFGAFHRFGLTQANWSFIFGFAGVLRMIALWINGRWPRTPYIRMFFATFGAISWVHVAALLASADGPLTTGPVVYSVLALYEFIAVCRASIDGRYSQHH